MITILMEVVLEGNASVGRFVVIQFNEAKKN